MERARGQKLGQAIGAVGFLILALNLVDYFAGWYAIADETALLGGALVLAGAYFALCK